MGGKECKGPVTVTISMDDIVSAGDSRYELITFSWDIIDVCQYNCSYCSAMNFNLNTVKHNPQVLEAWKNVITALSLKSINMPFAVEILGGEPTLHPHIYEIIEKLCEIDNCIQVDLITNLAKPLKFFQKLDNNTNEKLSIEASYHPEYCGAPYIQKVIELNKSQYITIYPNINLSDDPKSWSDTKELIDTFICNDVKVGFNFLQEVPDGKVGGWKPNYTDEFWDFFKGYIEPEAFDYQVHSTKEDQTPREKALTFLRDHAGAITTNIEYNTVDGQSHILTEGEINRYNLRRFKGWSCRAMMYHISMDGIIKNHCTHEVLKIYNLNKRELTSCRTCPLEQCDCDTKFLYVKQRNEETS